MSHASSSAFAPPGCSRCSRDSLLLFFSISTNQEYYTFPAWAPVLMLLAVTLAGIEECRGPEGQKPLLSQKWLTGAQAFFAILGILSPQSSGYCLWESRNLPYVADIGTLLAHRDVGGYTLSMSHFFDLTGPSFAALRLPAIIAALALFIGPVIGWILRARGKHIEATVSVALTLAAFLVAAHIAFARFEPMLSSKPLADTILVKGSPSDSFIIYGDQSDASSVVFYTHNLLRKPAFIVMPPCSPHGTGSSLVWGLLLPRCPPYLPQRRPALKGLGIWRAQMAFRSGRKSVQSGTTPRPPSFPCPGHRRQGTLDGPAAEVVPQPSHRLTVMGSVWNSHLCFALSGVVRFHSLGRAISKHGASKRHRSDSTKDWQPKIQTIGHRVGFPLF